eukprot:CAMPEP_0167755530 /NCGR_PEP_ID=MMETSP0110_2-20121227/8880_1 /TAXON_ID=629695 /ORGANISM="Gymnochlora sp., Strain CCMP2014" /LENGTH=780 /DNA_ID=CAMNT_0007641537 /DNA_START=84 /DNA_END=2426 /DNA_ORIENTATION=-
MSSSSSLSLENKELILEGLRKSVPEISPRWLYDDRGSELFEMITETDEYYLTRKELELLAQQACSIASFHDEKEHDRQVPRILVELGAGSGKKTSILLDALKNITDHPVTYAPIDVSKQALEENAKKYNFHGKGVKFQPYINTYQNCLPDIAMLPGRKTYLFLGSSLGNYSDHECVELMEKIANNMTPRDRLIIGVDTPHGKHKAPETIEAAYNDSKGLTAEFTLNAMEHVNRQAGVNFDKSKFKHIAKYEEDSKSIMTFVESLEDQVISDLSGNEVLSLNISDKIFMEQSRKFSLGMMESLGNRSGLFITRHWSTEDNCHLLVEFQRDYLSELGAVSSWIFDELAAKSLGGLLEQPIELRHPFLFYKGHIGAFYHTKCLDSNTKLGDISNDRGEQLSVIFERGMDPEIDEPETCHRHSPAPPSWPSFEETQNYNDSVRSALHEKIVTSTGFDRLALLGIEHECMHQETLIYMAANSDKLTPHAPKSPPGEHPKNMKSPVKFSEQKSRRTHSKDGDVVVKIPGASGVVMGATENNIREQGFVWDNEIPSLTVNVPSFQVSRLPVTNSQFLDFIRDGGYRHAQFWGEYADFIKNAEMPASWISKDIKDFQVRTLLDGPQSMEVAGKWPVIVSLAEANAYCRWLASGARVMSEEEYNLIFHHEHEHSENAFKRASLQGNNNWKYSGTVPVGSMGDATELFGISDLAGNGWEWTSSPFNPFPGFKAMEEYEEYSVDFFGNKHFVMKGGSPFTDLCLVRPTLRNWFQARYPYVWSKFRVSWPVV